MIKATLKLVGSLIAVGAGLVLTLGAAAIAGDAMEEFGSKESTPEEGPRLRSVG